jgi:hypothetical protein
MGELSDKLKRGEHLDDRPIGAVACCVCHALYRPHRDAWTPVGEHIYQEIMQYYKVSYGYCPKCKNDVLEEIKHHKTK